MTNHRPLVSVMMPCYQVAGTVHMALASLLAQTYSNWECLVIDDGSTDDLASAMGIFQDPRIRYYRLEANRGRGYAHAFALERARGEFLCTLDADDWSYPGKLQRQVDFLLARPDVAAVALYLAMVDHQHRMVGVFKKFAFGAAMLRTALARQVGFDSDFRRAQDFDFFRRLLQDRTYAVLPDVGYAYYFELGSSPQVVLDGLASNRLAIWKTLARRPFASAMGIMVCWAKTIFYTGLYRMGLWNGFQRVRRPAPTETEREDFERALATVKGYAPPS